MKSFCFTVDDNIRFFEELTRGEQKSLFDHPYLAAYQRLHERFDLKVQLNLFYQNESFNLTQMTDRFREEWRANSSWLKLSFHSKLENVKPYEFSGYDEVFCDCQSVHREILRFAAPESLAKTTTLHYCLATDDGLRAMYDCGVRGLLGLYGKIGAPRSSYQSTPEEGNLIRAGGVVFRGGIAYSGIDIVLNSFSKEDILAQLREMRERDFVRVMIHEQYFYPDYRKYQKDFEEKLCATFEYLTQSGYGSIFFEEKTENN